LLQPRFARGDVFEIETGPLLRRFGKALMVYAVRFRR